MFRLDKNRMHVMWTDGDKDLAFEFLKMEGFELVPDTMAYRCSRGWEQRIRYNTERLVRETLREKIRVHNKKLREMSHERNRIHSSL